MSESISIFLPSLAGGGAERMMVNLSNEFSSRGHHVDLVLITADGPYLCEVSDDVRVIDLNAPELPGYNAMGSLPHLYRYLESREPVALLSALTRANVVALLAHRLARVPTRIVISERNHLSSVVERDGNRRMRALPWLIRRTYPWADRIVPISHGVADDLSHISRIPTTEMDVIHNPAYSEDIREEAKEPLEHPWFQSPAPVILGVGSLTAQKDFATLVSAFERVRSAVDARLMILGEGEKRDELQAMVRDLGLSEVVEMPGFVDNPFKYMDGADVFVLSSRWEGFGNVIVEALACGTPVVSTDCPSGPAEILNDGEYGTLVPVGNPEAIADALLDVLEAHTDERRLENRAEQFSIDRIASQYLNVLLDRSGSEPLEIS